MATDTHRKMVAGIYRMIIDERYLIGSDLWSRGKACPSYVQFVIDDKMGGGGNFNDLCKFLEKYSLIELREILYLFTLIITTYCSGGTTGNKSMMPNLKLAIQFIEKDLSTLTDDGQNSKNLININHQLNIEREELKKQLEDIRNIMNK